VLWCLFSCKVYFCFCYSFTVIKIIERHTCDLPTTSEMHCAIAFSSEPIVRVVCGAFTSLALTRLGRAYICGHADMELEPDLMTEYGGLGLSISN
jgi:hypothetical protein